MIAAGRTAKGALTQEQIATYRERGYLVLPHVLSGEQLSRLRRCWPRSSSVRAA